MGSPSHLSKFGVILILLLLGASFPLGRLALFAISASQPGTAESRMILVGKGENPNDIIKSLMISEIITDPKDFVWVGRLTRQWKRIKAGEYELSASMSPMEIFSVLTSGISAAHPLTVREGENMYEIAEDLKDKKLIDRDHFLTLCRSSQFIESLGFFSKDQQPKTLEGYLYPDTYFFNRAQSDSEMLKQMVRHFFTSWGTKEDDRARELKMTRHQIVTLASMVEKETGAPEERAVISSVFYNRLRTRMKLQSDPTTIYGMWDHYHGKIHKQDLFGKNDYNTYYIEALPVGPIGNPGADAIHAALYPTTSPYFYFVSHNDGTHQFSTTFEQHNQAVKKFQLNPKAREGKSWRDHLKKPASVGHPLAN